jgi:pantoate--beta-alanine ligase
MKIISSIETLRKTIERARIEKKTIGFVPTMGYFHDGHLSLMKRAKKENDCLIVSIFVNPTQFGVNEDLEKYPRDMKRDTSIARSAGVDYLFTPSVSDMYPEGYCTYLVNEKFSSVLCGAARPGHFRGVLTVVCKLFNIVGADRAYFGQKDYQQLTLLSMMKRDLNMPTRIVMCPTVREKDGLAMSSRNVYLGRDERVRALSIYGALKQARTMIAGGERSSKAVIEAMKKILGRGVDSIDYVAVCSARDLTPLSTLTGKVFIGVAARVRSTRLIDNCIINIK